MMVAFGALLGAVVAGGVLLFAAGVRLARRGGRATTDHGRAGAERIRKAAGDRLIEAVTGLDGAREELERARSAGTVRRSAARSLARWEGARSGALRSAQSFEAFAQDRHDPLLRRLHGAGVLVWDSEGVPQVDPSWYPRSATGDVARLNRHLRGLEEIRRAALADGIAGPPVGPAPVEREAVAEWNARLDARRVDESAVARLVREGAFGRDLLAAHPARRAPRPDREHPPGPGKRRDPGPDWLRDAARRASPG
ncbi:hypothetical protein [Nocardiopsis potens]|uniref:hypothetical protein n=1 Tax=Nocardiopsis potens TaxID=1246458 RepID=UPI00034A0DD6|nr:hypothetical protein [Nocardiopsis potens]